MPGSIPYELLDFGAGRRLERFAGLCLDRPCPTAERLPQSHPQAWRTADARFQRGADDKGSWTIHTRLPERWPIVFGPIVLELKPTEFGHLGVFPEQAENWEWIARQVREAGAGPVRVLNLFAYTGGSTLAAAAAGAEVTHVDAARNVLAWARRNAELSSLATAPIRWIAEDALKFVRREVRRGGQYEGLILDPPSYGHGPRGEVWRLSRQLGWLLTACAPLVAGRLRFLLLTCHTPGYTPERLAALLRESIPETAAGRFTSATMSVRTAGGRVLPSGMMVRWG